MGLFVSRVIPLKRYYYFIPIFYLGDVSMNSILLLMPLLAMQIGNETAIGMNQVMNQGFWAILGISIISVIVTIVFSFLGFYERREERRELMDMLKSGFLVNTGVEVMKETEKRIKNSEK